MCKLALFLISNQTVIVLSRGEPRESVLIYVQSEGIYGCYGYIDPKIELEPVE